MFAKMSAYERLSSGTHVDQTTNQASSRNRYKCLKPQEEFLLSLVKLMGAQFLGFIITSLLGEISSQGVTAKNLNLVLTDTYYVTCNQATNAFLIATVSTLVYILCSFGYFLKKNQEKCDDRNIPPNMQLAIQNQIRKEIQVLLEKRTMAAI